MSHWLDAEEQMHHSESKSHSSSLSVKRSGIENNYIVVSARYNAFLEELYHLLERVNSLPLESRAGFGTIEGRKKDSKLNNHLNLFLSSRRKNRISIFDFLRFLNRRKYKNIRVVYFSVSSHKEMINIEIKERTLLRAPLREDKPEGGDGRHVKRQAHIVASLSVDMLDYDFALGVIDWLAFKTDTANSTVVKKLEQYGIRKK
jgi:hypothetical protein